MQIENDEQVLRMHEGLRRRLLRPNARRRDRDSGLQRPVSSVGRSPYLHKFEDAPI